MKFYDYPMAPSPRRARIILAEKGVPYEAVIVDIAKGEQLSDEFRKINPSCAVPALELEDGTVLTENAGIAAYLEAKYPNPPLLGTTPEERGLVAMWSSKVEFEGLLAVADALRNTAPAMKDRSLTGAVNWPQIPELGERGLVRVNNFLDKLNERLEGRDYVAIDSFSNADITAAVTVDFARAIRIKPGEQHTNILRWREQLNSRPSMHV